MVGTRKVPPRTQRSTKHHQDEPPESPMRTRSTRGAKELDDHPRSSTNGAGNPHKRKLDHSTSSSASASESSDDDGVHAEVSSNSYLVIKGLSQQFLRSLEEDDASENSPKKSKVTISNRVTRAPTSYADPDDSVTEAESSSSEEEDEVEDEEVEPQPAAPTRRGRGGRGRGRGGRGSRGGRGRGRGGRGRGMSSSGYPRGRGGAIAARADFHTHDSSDEESSQDQAATAGKLSNHGADLIMGDAPDEEHGEEGEKIEDVQQESTTPQEGTATPQPNRLMVPLPAKVSSRKSRTQTPQEPEASVTPAEAPVQKMLSAEEDALKTQDLPPPWQNTPTIEREQAEDEADWLLHGMYNAPTDPQHFVTALTKHKPAERSTDVLLQLSLNTFKAMKAWQNEYLQLDARTAPHTMPPKKPATGGRVPLAEPVHEGQKEADIYGSTYDLRKEPWDQNLWKQRVGEDDDSGGRALRHRRARENAGSAAPSEDDEEEENEGRSSRRPRRTVKRFGETSDTGTGANTPKKHNGWGGARRRGMTVADMKKAASETPEPDGRVKRGKGHGASALLPARVQEMREESAMTSSGDEGSSGRAKRSDAGIKKGPRKKNETIPAPATLQVPNVAPTVLQSLSQGQNQFSVAPRNPTPPPPMAPSPVSIVFQSAPQPSAAPSPSPTPALINGAAPDSFMHATTMSHLAVPGADQVQTGKKGKPRVKSEKRSQSMTAWWAERKARQEKEKAENGGLATFNTSARKTNRASNKTFPASDHAPAMSMPFGSGQVALPSPAEPQDFSNQSPNMPFAPPPAPAILQNTPLAALPSAPGVSRSGMQPLAPAPVQHQHTFAQPFGSPGPRSLPRKQSKGPPLLAAAPAHSGYQGPYPPVQPSSSVAATPTRDMQFRVMVPGPSPDEERK